VYRLADFEFDRSLGEGQYGRADLCRCKLDNQLYCLKVFNIGQVVGGRHEEHVQNEWKILSSLNHPFIVKLYSGFRTRQNIYFVMEYVPGGDLYEMIKSVGRLSNATARHYAAEILLILEYLQSLRIAHRDLKPENLLVDSTGHLKLADFGMAKIITDRAYTLCGSPGYIAPETQPQNTHGKGYGLSVDIFSFGAVIYKMLSGETMPDLCAPEEIPFPDYFHPVATDLLRHLLVSDPRNRLGCGTEGIAEIKRHEWFAGQIDWDLLFRKSTAPPASSSFRDDPNKYTFNPAILDEF
jgi:serine/threonine protein kinase